MEDEASHEAEVLLLGLGPLEHLLLHLDSVLVGLIAQVPYGLLQFSDQAAPKCVGLPLLRRFERYCL